MTTNHFFFLCLFSPSAPLGPGGRRQPQSTNSTASTTSTNMAAIDYSKQSHFEVRGSIAAIVASGTDPVPCPLVTQQVLVCTLTEDAHRASWRTQADIIAVARQSAKLSDPRQRRSNEKRRLTASIILSIQLDVSLFYSLLARGNPLIRFL